MEERDFFHFEEKIFKKNNKCYNVVTLIFLYFFVSNTTQSNMLTAT